MKRLGRSAALLFELLAGAFFVWFLVSQLRSGELRLPPLWTLVSAAALASAGIWLASEAWLRLLPNVDTSEVRGSFFLAQLGKYIPGGIWQPAGQIGLTSRHGVGVRTTTAMTIAHAAIQVATAALLGAPAIAALADRGRTLLAVGALLTLGGFGALAWPRVRRRFGGVSLPRRRATLTAAALLALNIMFQGAAFWVVARGSGSTLGFLPAVSGFSLAWVVGFLALPVPAGLGIREGILALLLPLSLPVVVAVSGVSRLVVALSELLLIGVSRLQS